MALDPTPAEDSILARLGTRLPNVPIFDMEVPEGESIPQSGGVQVPHLIVFFGNPVRGARDHHITGSRNDTSVV